MDPALYILLEPNAFVSPISPGPITIYPQFATLAQMKMINNVFARNKNYYLSLMNINQACFCMLDETAPDRYKISNNPNLTGWNASMSICANINQLMANYGMPDAMVLFNIDTLFQSPFPPTEAPKMLFYCTEQCQEIQTIGQDPYSSTHIINIVVCLLMQSGIFPIKEFKIWATVPNKTYPGLKTFIHNAYTRRLMAISLRNNVGSLGYMGNNQNVFNIIIPLVTVDNTDDNNATTVMQTAAAATTGSTLGNTYAASAAFTTFPADPMAAIQQLTANQTSIMQQFAAFTVNPHMAQHNNLHVPPVHNIHVPAQQAWGYQQQPGGFQQGHGGRRGSGCSWGGGQGGGCGGHVRTTYATGGVPQFVSHFGGTQQGFMLVANTGGIAPAFAGGYAPTRRG
jgi:hypothetical protein